jgi:mono/diheme cytochrome c family protein
MAANRSFFLYAGMLTLACVLSVGRVIAQSSTAADAAPVERWYSPEQVARGAPVYAENCAVCHGQNGEGTKNWRQRTDDGKFPPPPIDGTGHAWHHPFKVLAAQIKFGTPGGLGSMPRFADKLNDKQIIEAIAWFQNKWPDKAYAAWAELEVRSRTN